MTNDELFAIPEIEEYINEPLKCTLLQEDDPLLKPLEKLARGQRSELKPVDEAAKAEVDAREAVTKEQIDAAAALVGIRDGMIVRNAAGKEGVVAMDENAPFQRKMPTCEKALEPKKVVDESDAYIKSVDQKDHFEEWSV